MEPSTKEVLQLIQVHGISNVFSVILMLAFLGAFFFTLRWIFKTTAERERAMAIIINNGMGAITASINTNTTLTQQIAQNIKDGFDIMQKANEHQRAEHIRMLELINEYECKAK